MLSGPETESLFSKFMVDFGKSYYSKVEYHKRLQVFAKNLARIHRHNSDYPDDALWGVNEFTDLTEAEFRSSRLMQKRPSPLFEEASYLPVDVPSDLPDTWDWSEKGAVTGVKDQGSAGTCWSFSTTGNLEGQYFLAGNNLTSLSEEQFVDCDYNNCGVFGGWPYLAYQYAKKQGDVEAEGSYPYCCGTGDCYPCMADKNRTFCGPPPTYCNRTCLAKSSNFVPNLQVESWRPISKNETEIAAELISTGPLSVLLDAGGLQLYHSGVWNPSKLFCNDVDLDHAVLLVGYGTEKTLLSEKPYWLVKNSWGAKWGMNGYFKIMRGEGRCGINTCVSTGILAKA